MTGKVGFIGLGAMGGPMALNMVKAGLSLVVHDLDPAKGATLVAAGAEAAASAEAIADLSDRTICMVETTAQAEDVIAGEHGIIKRAKQGDIVVCMSTIDPLAAKKLAERLALAGVGMVDAPVSGELSVIVGGAVETFEACRDLFEAVGSNVFHVGPLGSGIAMKLVNNMLVQVNTVAVAEAMILGVKAGLDPQLIYDVVRVSSGASTALDLRVPRMITRDFEPGGTIDIIFKDQELETQFAKQLGVPLFLAAVSQQVYQQARARGMNKLDSSAIIKLYEEYAGVKVGED